MTEDVATTTQQSLARISPELALSGLSGTLLAASVICLLVAVGFAFSGYKLLFDDSTTTRVVGGDAYNFIIYAGRGTAYVCIGIVSALIGVCFAVFALVETVLRCARFSKATPPGAN